jgi:hypothetical protein
MGQGDPGGQYKSAMKIAEFCPNVAITIRRFHNRKTRSGAHSGLEIALPRKAPRGWSRKRRSLTSGTDQYAAAERIALRCGGS